MNDRSRESSQQVLLEIYKLHSELADRVSQRREGANRLFVTLLVGLLVFLATLLRVGSNGVSVDAMLFWGGITGLLLACSWFVIIRSYRQLNTGKFRALHELESHLPYQFFKREWDLLGQGKEVSRYWKLTVVETIMPIIFAIMFTSLVVLSRL